MTTTSSNPEIEAFEDQFSWAKYLAPMNELRDAAIARGVDPGLANYLAGSAAMSRSVMEHNARARGVKPLAYGSFEEFVLAHGQPFAPPDPKHPRPKGFRKGRDKLCFSNAAQATWARSSRAGWRYVEGYATSFIGCHHAWVLDQNQNVVETTWRDSGTAYVGIAFPEKIWHEAIRLKGTYGVFCSTLLEEPYDPEHPEAFIERLRAKSERERRW